MRRINAASLLVLAVGIPAAAASSFFGSSSKPCFLAGNVAYEISRSASAAHVVRIDNAAASPTLRMQLVDDPGIADFVLVDDGDGAGACKGAATIESIRVDPAASDPELTISLSRKPADHKIYVKSAHFSQQDAAALFAVIWRNAGKAGSLRNFANSN